MTTTELLDWIDTNIKANGNRTITGPLMNETLKKLMEWAMTNTNQDNIFANTSPEGITTQSLWDSYTDAQKFQTLIHFVSQHFHYLPYGQNTTGIGQL